jgi:hypothetical protein
MATELEIKKKIEGKKIEKYEYNFETNEHILKFEDGTEQVLYGSVK